MGKASNEKARIVVFSALFPHPGQPNAGVFIRERMFRVNEQIPLLVIAPQPWFPLQGLIRMFRPRYRPVAPGYEVQQGIEVFHPRFLSVPFFFRSFDGLSMALCSIWLMLKLKKRASPKLIDAHFAYPDGLAATYLGKWFALPVTITLRGTEIPISQSNKRHLLLKALHRATHIFSVADSLRQHVIGMGIDEGKTQVVGNGVDTEKFYPLEKSHVRNRLGIPQDAVVLVTVGGLVERKGFHRVIDCLPELRKKIGNLHYLIVGGASGEGDWGDKLKQQVKELNLKDCVHFLGVLPPNEINIPLSAADVFVLATRNEGWANVFLEAMACGLPVVTTDVGGNKEVVCDERFGTVISFGDERALKKAVEEAIKKPWDSEAIMKYAKDNSWDSRVNILVDEFNTILTKEAG